LGPQYQKHIGKPERMYWKATRKITEAVQREVEGAALAQSRTEEVKGV